MLMIAPGLIIQKGRGRIEHYRASLSLRAAILLVIKR